MRDDFFRQWLHRLRRAAYDGHFAIQPRITVSVPRGMVRLVYGESTTRAVDGRGRPVERIVIGGITVQWLAKEKGDEGTGA